MTTTERTIDPIYNEIRATNPLVAEYLKTLEERIAALEGKTPEKVIYNALYNSQEDCERHLCSYFDHYLIDGPANLTHEAYHQAERRCEQAQEAVNNWLNTHPDAARAPDYLERQANRWEEAVRA